MGGHGTEFWNKRVLKSGHTGWNSPVTYAYDQLARFKAITKVLDGLPMKTGRALDFGAGVGDFAALLARRFSHVLAFDISDLATQEATRRYGHLPNIEFTCADSILSVPIPEASLDLVLSVTVLGHLVKEEELITTLAYLRSRLCPEGCLVALEYTPEEVKPPTEYLRSRSFEQWESLLAQSGLAVRRTYGFYHPSEARCPSYDKYSRSPAVRLLRRLQFWMPFDRFFRRCARAALRDADDFLWDGKPDDVMKIMIACPSPKGAAGGRVSADLLGETL